MRATAFVIGHFLHSDDLENWKDLELIGVQIGSFYAYHNKPEWHEREHDDEHPYRDSTGWQQLRQSSLCIRGTCCEFQSENRIAAKYQSSSLSMGFCHGSGTNQYNKKLKENVIVNFKTNLLDADNFTSGLLELAQLTQEIPEPRLGNNMVRCKNPHSVERRIRFLLRSELAPDDFVFFQL